MPSPFPGMDPYLEDPAIWPDFHDALAGEIRNALNGALPPPYYARLEMRPEIGIVEGSGGGWRVVPDVTVVRGTGTEAEAPRMAVLERPRTEVSRSYEVKAIDEAIRHRFVEIRDPVRGHKLITLTGFMTRARIGVARSTTRDRRILPFRRRIQPGRRGSCGSGCSIGEGLGPRRPVPAPPYPPRRPWISSTRSPSPAA